MTMHPLLTILPGLGEFERLKRCLLAGEGPASVFGLPEPHRAHVFAGMCAHTERAALIVAASELAAGRLADEMNAYGINAVHFPARDLPLTGKTYASSSGVNARRVTALTKLCSGEKLAVCVGAEALLQRLAPPEAIWGACFKLQVGQTIEPRRLLEELIGAGYEACARCEGPGQVCLHGGRLDVYPAAEHTPCRIEFFDDQIDTMRLYDPLSQRATENIREILITPATEMPLDVESRERARRIDEDPASPGALSLLPLFYEEACYIWDYMLNGSLILVDEPARVEESAQAAHTGFLSNLSQILAGGQGHACQGALLLAPTDAISRLGEGQCAMFFALTRTYGLIRPKELFRFEARPIPSYQSGDEALAEDIKSYKKSGYTTLVYAGANAERVHGRLMDLKAETAIAQSLKRAPVRGESLTVGEYLPRGFEYPEIKFALITEKEIFGTARKKATEKKKSRPQTVFLADLSPGDMIVHEAHGIGRFTGVETLTVDGKTRDYLKIDYAASDKLFLPTDQLDRVQKYVGADGGEPKLSRLGGSEWQKTVSRARAGAKALAFDLVRLYGLRSKRKGFRFSQDTPWQRQMEAAFPYEETPDQLTCIEEIKADMQSDRVMDRLLCGDVGYGKTEVALRAAFKAAMDGKQAAFLVPTTILAQQHYNTLAARFAGFPIEVELLSRFKTPAEQRRIIERLALGRVDVIVGTHKLLGAKVRFHDLGLLVVDEEQRFGVGHKELIKNMKTSVDVLTLSATPIPRTLHMSMTGIRDMSVIETPPEQRYPVQTFVTEYSGPVIREAILRELGRGGQVYFVYNRVKNMDSFAQRLSELIPEARIVSAHGQMPERKLEKTMLDFMNGEYDVLLCSTIIESGLDIPNVNTIVVYDADYMGLSQLYQLRGRVGRGSRLGYAYLTFMRDKVLTEVAEKRLSAIRDFTQFGSGFRVAMRDLEIRGAGNLLGPEQHGHMAEVGYDLYCKLMDEALKEARGEPRELEVDTVMEVPLDAHISPAYIPAQSDRLSMYKRIASVTGAEDMADVQDELIDRYGDIPEPVQRLLDVALLKAAAKLAYITRIRIKEGEARLYFHPEAEIDPSALIEAANGIEGARLYTGDSPLLMILRKQTSAEEMFRLLFPIVKGLIGGDKI